MIKSNPIIFTIITIFALQAILFAGLILFKKPRLKTNIFLALLVFFYALIPLNIVLVNVLKDYDLLYIFRYIQMEMLYGIGPVLYFYTKCITNPKFTLKKKHYYHFIPFVLEFIFYRTSIYRIGSNGLYLKELPTYSYVYLTQQWIGVTSILVYSFISLGILAKHQRLLKDYYSKIKNLSLRWLQAPIIYFASYFILWQILTEADRFFFDRNLREYYFLPNFVLLSIVTYWIGFKGYVQKEREVVYLKPFAKKSKPITFQKDDDFISKINTLMDTRKPYLNPELNLSILAELLDMKPKQVSLKINQNFSKNFYDLINFYRVKEFQECVKSNNNQKLSLLGLAYNCGFNSKSTFNSVFKKQTKLTPTQYIKTLKDLSK